MDINKMKKMLFKKSCMIETLNATKRSYWSQGYTHTNDQGSETVPMKRLDCCHYAKFKGLKATFKQPGN